MYIPMTVRSNHPIPGPQVPRSHAGAENPKVSGANKDPAAAPASGCGLRRIQTKQHIKCAINRYKCVCVHLYIYIHTVYNIYIMIYNV